MTQKEQDQEMQEVFKGKMSEMTPKLREIGESRKQNETTLTFPMEKRFSDFKKTEPHCPAHINSEMLDFRAKARHMENSSAALCDVCHKQQKGRNKAALQCTKCSFNICAKCANNPNECWLQTPLLCCNKVCEPTAERKAVCTACLLSMTDCVIYICKTCSSKRCHSCALNEKVPFCKGASLATGIDVDEEEKSEERCEFEMHGEIHTLQKVKNHSRQPEEDEDADDRPLYILRYAAKKSRSENEEQKDD